MSRPRQKPFRKMRLVPIDEDEYNEDATTTSKEEMRTRAHLLAEKRVRMYDPVVSAMADLLPGIEHPTVRAHSRSSGRVKVAKSRARRSASAAAALQSASLQRYKALERLRMPRVAPSLPAPTLDVQVPQQQSAPSAVGSEAEVAPLLDVQVPRMYAQKLGRVLTWLSSAPGAVGRTSSDELVIDGAVLRGTSYSGAMRGLFVNTTLPPPGTRQLVARIRTLGIPKTAISSRAARSYYGQAGSGLSNLALGRFPGRPGRVLRVY